MLRLYSRSYLCNLYYYCWSVPFLDCELLRGYNNNKSKVTVLIGCVILCMERCHSYMYFSIGYFNASCKILKIIYRNMHPILFKSKDNLFFKKKICEETFSIKIWQENFQNFPGISEKCLTGKFPGKFSGKLWETFSSDRP